MKLEVTNIHIDPEGLEIKEEDQALINIQGTLIIYDGDNVFFEEKMITVVELAEQLNKWLSTKNHLFHFDSMDEEVDNVLVFTKQNNEWKVTSAWQKQEYSSMVTEQELKAACKLYIETLKDQVGKILNVNLHKLCRL